MKVKILAGRVKAILMIGMMSVDRLCVGGGASSAYFRVELIRNWNWLSFLLHKM